MEGAMKLKKHTAVYFCRMHTYTDALYHQHFLQLPPWRQEKVLRIKDRDKRKESTLSFILLQNALKNGFGIENFTFEYNEKGKPYLADRVAFLSMSHSREAVAAAVSRHEIGLDVECIRHPKEAVLNRMFTDAEKNCIRTSKEPDLAFTRLWTEKEAKAKLFGKGIWEKEERELTDSVIFRGWDFPSFCISVCQEKAHGETDEISMHEILSSML